MGNQKKLDRAKKNLSMPTPPLKKSALNFSPVEVDILLRQLDEQRHLLTGRVSNGTPLSASHIRQAWNKVAKEVSEVSSVARTGSDVREKWIDLQQRTRSKLAKCEKAAKARGNAGGKHQLTPLEEKVFSLIDVTQVLGVDGMEEGLTLDKVDKARVEVSKLKEGVINAMQKGKKSEADQDSTPPASEQDGSQSPLDSDVGSSVSDIVEMKISNGAKRSPTTVPKKPSSPTKQQSSSSPTKKDSVVRNESADHDAPAISSNEAATSTGKTVTKLLKADKPPPIQTPTSFSVVNGVVSASRKRIRVEENVDGEEEIGEGDQHKRKRVRQQCVERVKSQTAAQKLADIELRRLEMERSFAERRLAMDRELAERRLALEREALERRLLIDLDLQERKLRMQQDFCSRIVGTVEGLVRVFSATQEQRTSPRNLPIPIVEHSREVMAHSEEVVVSISEGTVTSPNETVTPPNETVTPPDETVTPPDETVTPPDEKVAPPDETVSPPEETVPPLEEIGQPPDVEPLSEEVLEMQEEVKLSKVSAKSHEEPTLSHEDMEQAHEMEQLQLVEEVQLLEEVIQSPDEGIPASDESVQTSDEGVSTSEEVVNVSEDVVEEVFVSDFSMEEEVIVETQADEVSDERKSITRLNGMPQRS